MPTTPEHFISSSGLGDRRKADTYKFWMGSFVTSKLVASLTVWNKFSFFFLSYGNVIFSSFLSYENVIFFSSYP